MELFLSSQIPKLLRCELCDYNTSSKKDYDKHLLTSKHKKQADGSILGIMEVGKSQKTICDICNKIYKTSAGLWKHKQKCVTLETVIENKILEENKPIEQFDKQMNLIMMLVKENSEFKNMMIEQQNLMMEVIKNGTSNTNISNTNTNSHNKAFNLNFFLNETCKNAMNITEFADSIKLQLSDFENVGDVGFITGISNIIIKNLKALDITQRPVHCTDQKREIIYIKDEDKWEKEDDKKQKFHKFLKKIINKNQRLLLKFQEVYPDYNKYSSPNSTRYDKIVIEALGGRGDNNLEKEDKILSIISKTIGIEK